ncbi:hypothetical protein MPSI1_003937 [Malassezia psittaci]|uniref:Xylanolytic transcriptional activator regulatory domain-containing protein n=1 Tax=Malassezia psittaci TaxID=1821823 RepID=A0AAF0JFX9_9BASI|nr:hypothetical protein MPSI1_003937 [Malassezia psittaci]
MDGTDPARPTKMRRMRKPRDQGNGPASLSPGVDDDLDDLSAEPPLAFSRAAGVLPLPLYEESKSLAATFQNQLEDWERRMESFFVLLPAPGDLDAIVTLFFERLEPLVGCMCESLFLREYEKLKACIPSNLWLAAQSRKSSKSTYSQFWAYPENYGLLALLFAILNASCDSMHLETHPARSAWAYYDFGGDFGQVLDNLHSASISLLTASQYLERPTLWILQAIILLQRRAYNKFLISVNVIANALAIRIAQSMGLNRLGSLKDDLKRVRSHTTLQDHPQGWVVGYLPWVREFAPNDLQKRELARKIWTTLVAADWLRSMHFDFSYMITDETNHTAPPAALTDEELNVVETLPDAIIDDPKRPSPQTYHRILLSLSRTVRSASQILMDKMLRHETLQLDLAQVREMDMQIGNVVQELPSYFRFDGISELSSSVQSIIARYPYLAVQRLLLQEMIHFRMLVLHAPHLHTVMRDPSDRRSLVACIEGACVVVTVWEELQRDDKSNPQIHYIKWHLIVAAVVLDSIIACIHANQSATSETDYWRLKSSLRNAVNFLHEPDTQNLLKRLPKAMPLDHLQRFCGSPEPPEKQEQHHPSSALPIASPFVNDFAQLGDAIPRSGVPDGTLDDADLLSSLDFLLTENGASMPDMNLFDFDPSQIGL